jgi:hypothetical protein
MAAREVGVEMDTMERRNEEGEEAGMAGPTSGQACTFETTKTVVTTCSVCNKQVHSAASSNEKV